MKVFHALNLYGQIVEEFLSITDGSTTLANSLIADLTTVHSVDNLFPTVESSLQFIEDHIDKFLGILLDGHIHWLSGVVLEGETELVRIVVRSIRIIKVGKQSLKLVNHVVVDQLFITISPLVEDFVLWLIVVCHQDSVPECWSHVELLDHGVHVANASQILYADIPLVGFGFAWWAMTHRTRQWDQLKYFNDTVPDHLRVDVGIQSNQLE